MVENWKRFKKRWSNYALLIDLNKEKRELQVALFENCLSDDALKTLEGSKFDTEENERTITQILDAFEKYIIGETNQTLERFKFAKRQQAKGEPVEKFIADLRVMLKTCDYCNACSDSVLRDQIVVGVASNKTRQELLKDSKLTLKTCIDTCKALETASTCCIALGANDLSVNTVHAQATELRQCSFCPYKHAMRKVDCPAWGKSCKKCGRLNHHHSKCFSVNKTTHEPQQYITNRMKRDTQVRYVIEESCSEDKDDCDEEAEWCCAIKTTSAKAAKCKMEVEGSGVTFLIDTGASINMLLATLAPSDLKPYKGTIQLWNGTEDTPLGCCHLQIKNPKNSKKYSVPFVVFNGDRVPILGYRTSLQMNLITVEDDNFNITPITKPQATQNPAVFNDNQRSVPGSEGLKFNPKAQSNMAVRTPTPVHSQLQKISGKLDAEIGQTYTRARARVLSYQPSKSEVTSTVTHKEIGNKLAQQILATAVDDSRPKESPITTDAKPTPRCHLPVGQDRTILYPEWKWKYATANKTSPRYLDKATDHNSHRYWPSCHHPATLSRPSVQADKPPKTRTFYKTQFHNLHLLRTSGIPNHQNHTSIKGNNPCIDQSATSDNQQKGEDALAVNALSDEHVLEHLLIK